MLFFACNKSDTPPGNPPIQMTAVIGGSNWSTTLGNIFYAYDTVRHIETFYAQGSTKLSDTLQQLVVVEIDSCTGLGTYKITAHGPFRCFLAQQSITNPQAITVDSAISGQVIISSLSKTLGQGIFNFKTASTSVTGGSFNLHIQN
jgi:hypothetical protein